MTLNQLRTEHVTSHVTRRWVWLKGAWHLGDSREVQDNTVTQSGMLVEVYIVGMGLTDCNSGSGVN